MTATGRTTVAQQGGVENFVDDGRARSSATKKTRTRKGRRLIFFSDHREVCGQPRPRRVCGGLDEQSGRGRVVGRRRGRIAAVVLLFKSFQKVRRKF